MFLNKLTRFGIPTWLLWLAIIFFIAGSGAGADLMYEKKYENKIYPRVYLGDTNLSGMTTEEAKEIINSQINKISKDGIVFIYEDDQVVIYPIVSSVESDLAYEIINFNAEKIIADAFNFGRDKNFLISLKTRLKALILKYSIGQEIEVNEKEIEKILKEKFSKLEIPGKDAKLVYEKNPLLENNLTFKVSPEQLGKIIGYNKGIDEMKRNLRGFNNSPIKLFSKTDYPKIYKKDALNVEAKAQTIIKSAPLTFNYKEKQWAIEKEQLAEWLALKENTSKDAGDLIMVGLDSSAIEAFLEEKIAPEINQNPVEAKFEFKDGRVTEFQASQDGLKLNSPASIARAEFELINNRQNKIDLIVEESKSKNSTGETNDLGIKEIIGVGKSNFAGSPVNRRHNIGIGAGALNGILIKPGEEFSLLKALGKIDASNGYKQELVIKDNRTTPEFGGGLCQIGTTMFRAALATGLEITQRRNHSYRVGYYEPAGTDATIYDPWPDLQFKNDTLHNILIQSRIEGNNLYFDFWGTKDGRKAEQTAPTIYNIVKPAPTRLIETLDLPVGEKKCTERAHNGADAYFDYKITFPNGEVKEKRFSSHYVPWQEVCLIGVEKLSEDTSTSPTAPPSQ